MFKRFEATDCSTSTKVKSSIQRAIKSKICDTFPNICEENLEEVLPKKSALIQYKAPGHTTLYCLEDNVPIFYQHRDDDTIFPTLKFIHSYPDLGWTRICVDHGAIPFVIGGANIMCPGLTNPGGEMPPVKTIDGDEKELQAGDAVVIYAEGKEHALAVGTMKLSAEDIRTKNKGIGVDVVHFLGDGLYQTTDLA